MNAAIEIQEVSKTFPRSWHRQPKRALSDVSFDIAAGETFGFIGQNGAGKSTLIKILVGALRPTEGRVRIYGKDTGQAESRLGLGFVPENPSLPDYLTPMEILRMAVGLHRLVLDDVDRHCRAWLERFDLLSVAESPLRGFSKGMQQRTALAHALAVRPRILILDEPLSGLDPVGRKDVVDILHEYKRGGGTLFFSSHVLYDVERIADRFGLIHGGRLLTIRSPGDVVADQSERYVIRFRRSHAALAEQEVVPAKDLANALQRFVADGCHIQEVKPERTLEAVFFSAIGENSTLGA